MSKHYDYYEEDEYVTDGAPASRQQTSTRRYPVSHTTQRPLTQRLQNEPVPARVPARRQRITNDVVSRYDDDDDGDTYDTGDFYNPYNPPTERESQLRSRRVPSRSGNTRQTEPVRRVVPQYVDEYVERPERPRVRADVHRPPVREKLHADQQSRRSFLADAVITIGLGAAAMTLLGSAVSAVQSVVVHDTHQMEEGELANKHISLVCGHHDSAANPTQLQASLYDDGTIRFMEFPGGDTSRGTFSFTPSIREAYHGDLSNVYLQIIPEQVTRTTYRIRLHMEIREMGTWTNTFAHDWFYVDDGKGKFVATK